MLDRELPCLDRFDSGYAIRNVAGKRDSSDSCSLCDRPVSLCRQTREHFDEIRGRPLDLVDGLPCRLGIGTSKHWQFWVSRRARIQCRVPKYICGVRVSCQPLRRRATFWSVRYRLPISRIPSTPAATYRLSIGSLSQRWTCMSHNAGIRYLPDPSIPTRDLIATTVIRCPANGYRLMVPNTICVDDGYIPDR